MCSNVRHAVWPRAGVPLEPGQVSARHQLATLLKVSRGPTIRTPFGPEGDGPDGGKQVFTAERRPTWPSDQRSET